MRFESRRSRPGTVLPLLACCIIGLCAFVALAIDLGLLAVSRTQAQNAADVAALSGARTLNNKPASTNSNLAAAVTQAKTAATSNPHLSKNYATADISKVEVGQYLYDTSAQQFSVGTWTDVTGSQATTPPSGSWTAMQVTISTTEPTYFMKVMGVTSMPSGARAVAVYRPRDIAFVLDMTGSMAYSSSFNSSTVQDSSMNNQSLNPDDLYPTFGHYVSTYPKLYASANQTNSGGEAIPRNNYSIATPAGPPIVRNFYFDPVNINNPTVAAVPVTPNNLKNAFHRWSPTESGGNSTTYTPPTYDFTGYNAFHKGNEAAPMGPIPAPDSFKTMTDSSSPAITYVGDRWRRADGSIDKGNTTWTGTKNRPASHAADLLGYGSSPPSTGIATAFAANWSDFRDPVWETYGYDLDIPKYRRVRGTDGPWSPDAYLTGNANNNANNILVPAADRFQGFSMGPGYWGKTFYIWPPDPRTPVGNPGDANYQPGDWRLRYFLNGDGNPLDPQADNNPWTSGVNAYDGVNEVILRNGDGLPVSDFGTTSSPNWRINYPAVLKWIKSGPMVMPPNVRAGRVLYYTSIPDDVDTSTGDANQKLDKVFWKNYIDYVIGWNYTAVTNLYGRGDSWIAAPASIYQNDLNQYAFTWETSGKRPYMNYTDSPSRPRLHFWFGPLSFLDFIAENATPSNWNPGTCYEAHSWQLKAGVNAVLDDVRNNHPNDCVGMTMFAAPQHNGIRVPMGQDFAMLKNALFYPKSLLTTIGSGNTTTELRPYNLSFASVPDDEIPNAGGSTDPNTGLAYAYNLLSPSSQLPTAIYGNGKGRRGAAKIVIFETDGVPNTYRSLNFTAYGYDSYYTTGSSSGNQGNGNWTCQTQAYGVIQQIVKPMAPNATNGADSGLSLPNAPARVYPIAFGDLFDTNLAPNATYRPTALSFLAKCAEYGGTGPAGASTLSTDRIITGTYDQRISTLKDCLQHIFQSGVSVTLIE